MRLRPDMRVRPGMPVCRLTDARQMAQAALPEPSIAVDMRLTAFPGQPLTLWLSDGESVVTVSGPEARAGPLPGADGGGRRPLPGENRGHLL